MSLGSSASVGFHQHMVQHVSDSLLKPLSFVLAAFVLDRQTRNRRVMSTGNCANVVEFRVVIGEKTRGRLGYCGTG